MRLIILHCLIYVKRFLLENTTFPVATCFAIFSPGDMTLGWMAINASLRLHWSWILLYRVIYWGKIEFHIFTKNLRLLHSNSYISVVAVGIRWECRYRWFCYTGGIEIFFYSAEFKKRRIFRSWYYVRLDAIRLLMRRREDYIRNRVIQDAYCGDGILVYIGSYILANFI